MAKRRDGEKRAQLCFMRPEDLKLFQFLAKRAYEARYDISTFVMVSLHEAFKGQIEEEEVSALAEEAVRKVRERTNPPQIVNGVDEVLSQEVPVLPPAHSHELSMEQAMKQAEAQIASLDAVAASAMKKKAGARKGVPSPPPIPQ